MAGFNPINSLIGFGAGTIFSALGNWMIDSAIAVFDAAIRAAMSATEPNLGTVWFRAHYMTMFTLAALAALPLLLLCAIGSVVQGDARPLLRAVGVQLPLAFVATGMAVTVLSQLIGVTDWLCKVVWVDPGKDLVGLGQGFLGVKVAGAAFVAGLLIVGALTLWLELALRQAAISAIALLLPLFLAGLLWPATAKHAKRAVETLVALVLSKFVIAAVLSLGFATVDQASPSKLQPLMAGAALTFFASLAPWVLLRLVPIVEGAAAVHLDGTGRRAMQATPVSGIVRQTPHLLTEALRGGGAASAATGAAAKAALASATPSAPADASSLDTSARPLVTPNVVTPARDADGG